MFETFAVIYGCFFVLACVIWGVMMRFDFIPSQSFWLKLAIVAVLLFVAMIGQWAMVWGEILTFGLVFVTGFSLGIMCLIIPLYGVCFAFSWIKKIDLAITLRTMLVSFLFSLVVLFGLLNLLFFLFRMEIF